jgi:hypothetical protein
MAANHEAPVYGYPEAELEKKGSAGHDIEENAVAPEGTNDPQ